VHSDYDFFRLCPRAMHGKAARSPCSSTEDVTAWKRLCARDAKSVEELGSQFQDMDTGDGPPTPPETITRPMLKKSVTLPELMADDRMQLDPSMSFGIDEAVSRFQEDGLTDSEGNHYSLCEQQGAVIQALRDDGCLVAIKFLRGGAESSVCRRQLEVLAGLSQLQHPHIVEVLGYGEIGRQVFSVTEFVGAGSLHDIMQKIGLLKPRQAAAYTSDVLSGLEYLHSRGVVHGNIKPDNVLVTPEGRCKLGDFGLTPAVHSQVRKASQHALIVDRLKNAGASALYTAPETTAEGLLSPRTDIWSVGLVLLEVVTGKTRERGPRMRTTRSTSSIQSMRPDPTDPAAPVVRIPDTLPHQLQDFLGACLGPAAKRPTAQALRQHAFIKEWRPTAFGDDTLTADLDVDVEGEDLSSSVMLETSGVTDKLLAAAACSDLTKAIYSIVTYQESDFIYNATACLEMISIARNLQPYVAHVVQFPAMATNLHAALLDATKLLMQCTKGWQKIDLTAQQQSILTCCRKLAAFMDCKGRWGKRIYLDDEAHELQKAAHFNEAEDIYRAAQTPDPFNVGPLFDLARLEQFIRRDMDKATELYHRILGIDPNHVQTLVGLGVIAAEADPEQAQRHFAKAIELGAAAPDSVALAYMGDFQSRKGEMCCKAARVHLTRQESGPAAEQARKCEQHYSAAMDWYVRAVGMDPCNSWALGQMAHIHRLRREDTLAEEKYRQAVAVDPSNGFALSGLGWTHVHKRLYVRAQQCFSDALLFTPKDSWALCGMGVVLWELHRRHKAAEHYFRQALEYDGANDWAYVYLARIALQCHQRPPEAQGLCIQALSGNPTNAWAIELLNTVTPQH